MTLAEYLEAKDLKDGEFAKKVGCSRGYIAQLRLGLRSNPNFELAGRIALATKGAVPLSVWASSAVAA